MNKPELLSPVGDFECLKAAVQNGADSVYLGTNSFNARARAKNFDMETLKEAIKYCKLRNVKVHITLNILIKNNEFEEATKLAIDCYNLGADAFIIQDLGLLKYLTENYPEIPVHSSTQMTTHNLASVKQLENMGVKRVVLSRELSVPEIENICKNSNVEIETFLHGALCISYSGQCLFSSIIGGRSGNRGLCAGPCRLPYSLLSENEELDKGYLLSPRDLNGTSSLPALIRAGISCFKIEGRLKNPEYVGVVTKYYRNLIDIVYDNIDKTDKEILDLLIKKENEINPVTSMTYLDELKQSFNRGGFSNGHLLTSPNRDLIYKESPTNNGFYLGKVEKFKPNKGYITLKLEHSLQIGDKVRVNSDNYTVSELMDKSGSNIKSAEPNETVTIGRIKGDIYQGQKLYRIQSKVLNDYISPSFKEEKEFRKTKLNCVVNIKSNEPISLRISSFDNSDISINNFDIITSLDVIPEVALNKPTDRETVISQISKTGNTPFEFENIEVNLSDNVFVPIKTLNELRRASLEKLEETIIEKEITSKNLKYKKPDFDDQYIKNDNSSPKINLLLNIIDENEFYDDFLLGIDKLYISLKYFILEKFENKIKNLCNKFNVYIYNPSVIRDILKIDFNNIVDKFNIKGFVVSSISQIDLLKKYNLELIGNYNLNIYNSYSMKALKDLGIASLSITPELNDFDTLDLIKSSLLPLELFVYGNIPLMTMNYCLLGKSNKCYKECNKLCLSNRKFYLKDRLGLDFRVLPDNVLNLTQIFNSKITSFDYSNYNVDSLRISVLDESKEEIKEIISNVKNNIPFKGNNYCSHFNKFEQL